MKISILTPTFNHGQYLRSAIESVRHQDVSAEHVIADGGSHDETLAMLKSYGDDVAWVSGPDEGQSDALNRALDMSTGDILGWLNADEFYLPGALGGVESIFASNPGVDVVVADSVLADTQARALRLYPSHRLSRRALQAYDCYILTSSVFIRRSSFGDFRWDIDLKMTMDWDLLLFLVSRKARFLHVPVAMSVFRVYPEQASARLAPRRAQEVALLGRRYEVPLGEGNRFAWMVGRMCHVLWRVLDGGLVRELRFDRKYRGSDTDWSSSSD